MAKIIFERNDSSQCLFEISEKLIKDFHKNELYGVALDEIFKLLKEEILYVK
jgi:hypothetical protein